MSALGTWEGVRHALTCEPEGTVLRVPKFWLGHPADFGAARATGLPFGQIADFRWHFGALRGLHVRDFGAQYEAHLDRATGPLGAIDNLRADAPEVFVVGMGALGALVGGLLGRSKEA